MTQELSVEELSWEIKEAVGDAPLDAVPRSSVQILIVPWRKNGSDTPTCRSLRNFVRQSHGLNAFLLSDLETLFKTRWMSLSRQEIVQRVARTSHAVFIIFNEAGAGETRNGDIDLIFEDLDFDDHPEHVTTRIRPISVIENRDDGGRFPDDALPSGWNRDYPRVTSEEELYQTAVRRLDMLKRKSLPAPGTYWYRCTEE